MTAEAILTRIANTETVHDPCQAQCFADIINTCDALTHNSPVRQDQCYPHSTDEKTEA